MIHTQPFHILSDKPFIHVPGADQVHLWLVSTDMYAPYQEYLFSLLTNEEQAKSGRFLHPADTIRFVVAKALCRVLLASYLSLSPAQISFGYSATGKPFLSGSYPVKLQFNYSHSGKYILFACTLSSQIGVDIEFIRPDFDFADVAAYFFTTKELAIIRQATPRLSRIDFYKIWTLKESLLKATGTGISVPLNTFDVSIAVNQLSALVPTSSMTKPGIWRLYNLPLADICCAALAVEGKGEYQLQVFTSHS